MQQRLSFITLGVRDLAVMRDFYVEKFGWQVHTADESIVFFQLNGIILGLFGWDALAEDANVRATAIPGTDYRGFTLALNVASEAEVDTLFEQFSALGVTITQPPGKVFWGGYRGYIADPEGNLWEICYNPFIKMDEQANVEGHESLS